MTNRIPYRRLCSAGFTLTELMIVVVIVTILALIAIPSYNAQIRQSRRTEARTAVLELASREEKYFSTANSYSTDPTQLGYSATAGAMFPQSTGEYYQINVTVPDPSWTGTGPSYVITATPATGSPQYSDTQCTSFSVTQTGVETATGTLGDACWQQ
jgi:type IV pilus assembly protein PilE